MLAGGRLQIAGQVSATIAPDDTGFFDYVDYDYSLLRLLRLADKPDLPRQRAARRAGEPIAQDYQQRVKSDLFLVTGRSGRVLAETGTLVPPDAVVRLSAGREGLAGRLTAAFWPHPKGIMQVITVPISVGAGSPEILGTLSLGFLFDDRLCLRRQQPVERVGEPLDLLVVEEACRLVQVLPVGRLPGVVLVEPAPETSQVRPGPRSSGRCRRGRTPSESTC